MNVVLVSFGVICIVAGVVWFAIGLCIAARRGDRDQGRWQ